MSLYLIIMLCISAVVIVLYNVSKNDDVQTCCAIVGIIQLLFGYAIVGGLAPVGGSKETLLPLNHFEIVKTSACVYVMDGKNELMKFTDAYTVNNFDKFEGIIKRETINAYGANVSTYYEMKEPAK